ncbi:MAG: EAL domain-containing protein [Rhodospirillaceae bacterium]|jgi:EAL domain-containing protein (putative c-di-GMP-specific phosphodiesterase class I)|nr:EAL domain-containing protein [Rhodospirillaceae bacterium]
MNNLEQSAVGVSGYVETLKRERDRFVALAFCAADLLLEVGSDNRITFAAGASYSLLGSGPEELVGKPLLDLVVPEGVPLVAELLKGMAPGSRLDPIPIKLIGVKGPTVPLSLMGYHLPDLPGNHFFAIRLGSPANSVETLNDESRDPESGLLEKEAFAEFATQQIREAGERGETLKLTMVHTGDLDDLRARMDAEHAENAIRSMGACLQANAAGGQAAGQLDDGAYGFLHKPGLNVDKITDRVEEIFKAADPTGEGISVNTGTVDAGANDMTEADSVRVLLYTVNQFCESGGENFTMASLADNLKSMTRETTEKLAKFKVIAEQSRFDVAFQPIVALDTREIHHFEALARFGKRLDRSPYDLITFAENTGVISDFDLAMARRVLEWLVTENAKGANHVVAVNVSGQSIANTGFVAALHDLLQKFDAIRSQLMFEITESARIDDLDAANRFIQGLRAAGHEVCLDDFGAGAAALRYLHALEVDVVKIDGQYVRNAMEKQRNQAFLKAVAGLCHDLGIATIAEMIEDEPCATMLSGCGVRFGQGYMFGRPSFDVAEFQSLKTPPQTPPVKKLATLPKVQETGEVIMPDEMKTRKPTGSRRPKTPQNRW